MSELTSGHVARQAPASLSSSSASWVTFQLAGPPLSLALSDHVAAQHPLWPGAPLPCRGEESSHVAFHEWGYLFPHPFQLILTLQGLLHFCLSGNVRLLL